MTADRAPRPGATEPADRPGPLARALLAAVAGYRRAISPLLPPRCRFEPSCSAYAAEAISGHGAGRGAWLALRRLLRCGPWHPGGWDPVPPPARTSPALASPALPAHPEPVDRRSAPQEARVA